MDLVYRLAIATSRLLFRLLGLRIRVEGAEHVPRVGPAIVVSNHVSFLDFIFVGLAARPSGRFVRFLTRYDVWHNAIAGPAMTAMRHVPVDRAAPAGAFLEARGALIRGEVVGIFPEAGISRSFTVRAMMPGAVALSRSTGARVVLVAVWGPQRIATAGLPISLRRGRAGLDRGERADHLADRGERPGRDGRARQAAAAACRRRTAATPRPAASRSSRPPAAGAPRRRRTDGRRRSRRGRRAAYGGAPSGCLRDVLSPGRPRLIPLRPKDPTLVPPGQRQRRIFRWPVGVRRRQLAVLIIPAPTVTPVASSMRMNEPVVRFFS
ncbi:MAG: lysophospholipid acyltransferase family protein [Nocardioidaceae bacterium]